MVESYLNHQGKRPNNSKNKLREEIIEYVRIRSKQGHLPSCRELQNEFHFKLGSLFDGIEDLYAAAGVQYKLPANQEIKSQKAGILLEMVRRDIAKFGLNLVTYRKVTQRGIDIIGEKDNKKIGIEIKAYNKFEKLKSRDIEQVKRFLVNEDLDSAIIITTADTADKDISSSDRIRVIKYQELSEIIGYTENKQSFDYIRDRSTNREDVSKEIKRKIILDYVLSCYNRDRVKPTYNNISKNLHLDPYSYFDSLFQIYKILKILPPTKNMGGKRAKNPDMEIVNMWKEECKKFILEEVQNGRYPSGKRIAQHFGVSHIWNIVNMSEIYQELDLPSYRERKNRTTSARFV